MKMRLPGTPVAMPASNSLSRWELPAAMFVGLLSFMAWTLFAGPDLNFDFLNYHLYAGQHVSGDTLARDFFPAGASSYLAPYAHWPIGFMVAARWPGMLVGAGLGALHSLAFVASWYLARQLFTTNAIRDVALRWTAAFVAVICPLVLTEVGTSFVDITTAIPCVFGVAILLEALGAARYRLALTVSAGILFGLAVALKLTNAPFALAAGLTVGVVWVLREDVHWTLVIAFGIAMVLGFLAAYGLWGWRLWQEFGNPVFPFFNSVFQAADPASVPAVAGPAGASGDILDGLTRFRASLHQRFLPHGLSEWLLRPLYMIDPVANVYTEVRAPDARFFALFCLAPIALWKVRAQFRSSNLVVLLLFFMTAWFLWMGLFGNGRYMMPLALLAGPALLGCANACWPARSLVALAAGTVFVIMQAALLIEGSQLRWAGSPWQRYWITAKLPAEVTAEPVTFVSLDGTSASWLTTFAHPESRFVFPGARNLQPARGKGADKFTKLLEQSAKILVIFGFKYFEPNSENPYPASPGQGDLTAAQIGLQIDFDSCKAGHLIESDPKHTAGFMKDGVMVARTAVQGFFFCRAEYMPETRIIPVLDYARESVFSNVERACPGQFPPATTQTTCSAALCWRTYASTDKAIIIDGNGAVTSWHYGAFQEPYMGSVEALSRDASKVSCHEDLGRYSPWSPGENLLAKPPALGK